MGDVSMEQKLKLVKQIRSRYNEDQYDLSNRERILYGKTSGRPAENITQREQASDADNPVTFFRIRVLLAILLFAVVIIMDRNDTKVAGITAEEIFRAISADYEQAIDSWAETLSMQNAEQGAILQEPPATSASPDDGDTTDSH